MLSRFAVALGGFLIFVGIIITGVFVISFLELVNFNIIETELRNLILWLLMTTGLLDLVAGYILFRR